jgi:hypothetical protein
MRTYSARAGVERAADQDRIGVPCDRRRGRARRRRRRAEGERVRKLGGVLRGILGHEARRRPCGCGGCKGSRGREKNKKHRAEDECCDRDASVSERVRFHAYGIGRTNRGDQPSPGDLVLVKEERTPSSKRARPIRRHQFGGPLCGVGRGHRSTPGRGGAERSPNEHGLGRGCVGAGRLGLASIGRDSGRLRPR